MILFLHGSGERGDDGSAHLQVGLPVVLREDQERYPALVVMPQCPRGKWWTDPETQEQALGAVTEASREFGANLDRLALTGLSMGGYGTWSLAWRHPGRFRALAPVCGGINLPEPLLRPGVERDESLYAQVAEAVGETPVWIFHGADDNVVPAEESRKMALALRERGHTARYTEYPNVGHVSWDCAYWDAELPGWLCPEFGKP